MEVNNNIKVVEQPQEKRNKCVLLCNRETTEQVDTEEVAGQDRKKKMHKKSRGQEIRPLVNKHTKIL